MHNTRIQCTRLYVYLQVGRRIENERPRDGSLIETPRPHLSGREIRSRGTRQRADFLRHARAFVHGGRATAAGARGRHVLGQAGRLGLRKHEGRPAGRGHQQQHGTPQHHQHPWRPGQPSSLCCGIHRRGRPQCNTPKNNSQGKRRHWLHFLRR